MVPHVAPTPCGKDLVAKAQKRDAHIRYKEWDEDVPWAIVVDMFDSTIKDANQAHLDSRVFENTRRGRENATVWLKTNGFKVVVDKAQFKKKC